MWASIKSFFKNVWNNIVRAAKMLVESETTVDEFGNEIPKATPTDRAAAKVAAFLVVSAGLFFTLFPFANEGAVTLGGQMIRVATIMWNGAT